MAVPLDQKEETFQSAGLQTGPMARHSPVARPPRSQWAGLSESRKRLRARLRNMGATERGLRAYSHA